MCVQIGAVLTAFQNHPESWTRADAILDRSSSPATRLVATNILQETIKSRWKILPAEQRGGIKTYVVNLIIKLSSDPKVLAENKTFLTKLNMVLVQIVKQEWPDQWPNFIPELVHASKTSQSLCANNMNILLLLSEEVFDYSGGQMTQEKMKTMKKNLNREFTLIFELCMYILDHSTEPPLLTETLRTLLRFLHWIPIGYIFETKLISTLALKFFPVAQFQNDTLQCLSEIGGLKLREEGPAGTVQMVPGATAANEPKYNASFVNLFLAVMSQVCKLMTPETDIARIYAQGATSAQEFIRHLAIFITSFLKSHIALVETESDQTRAALGSAIQILLRISRVDDSDVFKICLEYWIILVTDLYNTQRLYMNQHGSRLGAAAGLMGGFGLVGADKPGLTPISGLLNSGLASTTNSPRLQMYLKPLQELRLIMISKMARPEEVLIIEVDGEIERATMKDTDALILYRSMREALIYLTHLDPQDAQDSMLAKLDKQVDTGPASEWSWHNLNTLCWAIGSISGALSEQQEKSFLVRVIKDLLGLCEMKRGKDHKAVIASNIMYVVGQYPRFLRQHWKFLKTVVNKLIEFMHEPHPGVQDMSVDTFLKIAKKCRKKFVTIQPPLETRPFIEELLENMQETIKDLEAGQIHVFYEAVGEIIQCETDPNKRQNLVFKLMELPNQHWSSLIATANHDAQTLFDPATVKRFILILKTNNRVAGSLGPGYIVQLARIYVDMLQVYKMYSGYVSARIAESGSVVTRTAVIRSMRTVKKEALNLIRTFITNSQDMDRDVILNNFIPALLDPVLDDYARNVPDARDAEVLLLFADIINKMGPSLVGHVPRIFESVFQTTLDMINKNFEEFPDHRINFFRLIEAINRHAFPALLRLNAAQFQLVMDSVIWAMKHLERNIADTGLQILFDLINNVTASEVANDFYKTYFISLLQDILGVLTDTFHKPGFRLQTLILAKLFSILETGAITAPLWVNAVRTDRHTRTRARATSMHAHRCTHAHDTLDAQ